MFTIGSRVLVAGEPATVRYLGDIDGQDGEWAGVEWDNPARGKHDGSTGGRKYFALASGHPTGGSFIRAAKLDAGITLVAAITKKYRPEGGAAAVAEEGDDLYAVTARGEKKAIELVGMDKIMRRQGALDRLAGAYVPDARVTRVGTREGELRECCPNVRAVDVSGNYLADWAALNEIGVELPSLETLHISRTRVPRPAGPALYPGLRGLQTLVLNNAVGIDAPYITALGRALPSLKELHIGGNGLGRICTDSGDHDHDGGGGDQDDGNHRAGGVGRDAGAWAALFPKLETLNLEGNLIEDWEEIWALRFLPSLRSLNLNDNKLTAIHYAATPPKGEGEGNPSTSGRGGEREGEAAPFANLEALFVGSNALSEWSHVDAVHMMPRVTEARFSGNPVVERTEWTARYELIARVGKLKVLNGSTVGGMERRDCEIRYVRTCEGERIEGGLTAAQISLAHPRYPELAKKYAGYLSSVSTAGQQQAATLASEIVNLRLTCVSTAQGAVMGQVERRLPAGTKLDKVKMVCERLFKIPTAEIVLFFKASPEAPMPEPMGGDDAKDLAYFNARDGSELIVDSIAVDARAQQDKQQREAARRELDAREQLQLYARDSVVQRAKDEDYY